MEKARSNYLLARKLKIDGNFRSQKAKWYDKLFNVKYLVLFYHFKAIYQFPKHIIRLVKIVTNVSLSIMTSLISWSETDWQPPPLRSTQCFKG